MLADGGVLIDPVGKQSRLELIFLESVLNENPVVSDRADEHWHHHWVLAHLVDVVIFEQIEGEIVGSFDKLNGSVGI